jgi:hypothetical protein
VATFFTTSPYGSRRRQRQLTDDGREIRPLACRRTIKGDAACPTLSPAAESMTLLGVRATHVSLTRRAQNIPQNSLGPGPGFPFKFDRSSSRSKYTLYTSIVACRRGYIVPALHTLHAILGLGIWENRVRQCSACHLSCSRCDTARQCSTT